jgi:hypothetical protein
LIAIVVAMLAAANAQDNVLGCSGRIESASEAIDMSKVSISLFTEHGTEKDNTDCAPNSGFFFIPIYEHAKYVLRVSDRRKFWKMYASGYLIHIPT